MHPVAVAVIYFLVWWCVFFAVLPFGVTSRWENESSDGVVGADPGAPSDPGLKKKAMWTSIIALPIALAIIAIVLSGVFNFRE